MACASLSKCPFITAQASTGARLRTSYHVVSTTSPSSLGFGSLDGSKFPVLVNSRVAASTALQRRRVPLASPICAKVGKGDVPPNFTLKNQDGKNVSLSQFKGKPVVVYFYPADETPGCTKEACAFRDSYEKFKKAGAEVVGISGDDPVSHKVFAKKYKLPFTLLSDGGNKVRQEWGVPSDLFGMLPGRQTYVLDKKGVVQLVYNNQFQPEKHIDETLKILSSI